MINKKSFGEMIRSATFGVEDSLVSTVGLLTGVASAGLDKATVILTGIVLILVEALSMAVGEIMAIESEEEAITHKEFNIRKTIPAAIIMFVAYVLAGLVPLTPYVLFEKNIAFPVSIIMSILGLFGYGFAYGKRMKLDGLLHGFRMMILGGSAIAIGVLVGGLFR